jgi:ribosomal protein L3 glutamine methyltransferase
MRFIMKQCNRDCEDIAASLSGAATPRELIRRGAELFEAAGLVYGHGTDNALDESAVLVLHALGIDYGRPDAVLDEALATDDCTRAAQLLALRISSRKPAAYLIHEAWFAGMPFYVDERVLVPRSPIAELVEAQFAPWVRPAEVQQVLDLCTGSGCIGIACAHYFPAARVTLADLSADALDVARINIGRHGLDERVTALQSDVFDALEGYCFDIIVSNPPYVPQPDMQGLGAEYQHEPALGLVAGIDGLDIVLRILRDAARHLNEHGILVVEVGCSQDLLVERFPEVPFVWLEFEFGGEGVFLLDRAALDSCQHLFDMATADRAAS